MNSKTRKHDLPAPLLLICILLAAGCGRNTGLAEQEEETGWIALEEIFRIGDESVGDTIIFGPINKIIVNQRGEIIVAERRPLLVSLFGADGTYQHLVGGYGEGPGEYQYLGGAALGTADSVYLWEFSKNQIMVYDPADFAHVRSIEVKDDGEKQFNALIGAMDDGWIMAKSLPPFLESDDGSMTPNTDLRYELIKVSPDGTYGTDLLSTVSQNEMIFGPREGGGFNFFPVPFGRSPAVAIGYDDVLYYGWNDVIEIATVSADGSVRDTIRYEHDPVPITDSEMTEATPEFPAYRELVESHDPHETKPAFQTFVVDEMGRVWIKLSIPEDAEEAEWLILNRESHRVGRTILPAAVELEVIQGGYAYGIHHERDAAPMVVVYRIQE